MTRWIGGFGLLAPAWFPPRARLVASSVTSEASGRDAVLFRVRVPARGESVLTYRLRLSP